MNSAERDYTFKSSAFVIRFSAMESRVNNCQWFICHGENRSHNGSQLHSLLPRHSIYQSTGGRFYGNMLSSKCMLFRRGEEPKNSTCPHTMNCKMTPLPRMLRMINTYLVYYYIWRCDFEVGVCCPDVHDVLVQSIASWDNVDSYENLTTAKRKPCT